MYIHVYTAHLPWRARCKTSPVSTPMRKRFGSIGFTSRHPPRGRLYKRTQYIPKRALYTLKRALHTLKRAQYTLK